MQYTIEYSIIEDTVIFHLVDEDGISIHSAIGAETFREQVELMFDIIV